MKKKTLYERLEKNLKTEAKPCLICTMHALLMTGTFAHGAESAIVATYLAVKFIGPQTPQMEKAFCKRHKEMARKP